MKRFVFGLLVGAAAGWMVAWWRLEGSGDVHRPGGTEEPMRIALPDMPWGDEEAVPAVEPVDDEATEPAAEDADEEALARARDVAENDSELLAYCARCRTKRPVQNPEPAVAKDGRPAVRGTCPECGANMFRFVSY